MPLLLVLDSAYLSWTSAHVSDLERLVTHCDLTPHSASLSVRAIVLGTSLRRIGERLE